MHCFKNSVINIRSWTFMQSSCMPRAGSIHCVGWIIWICPIVIGPHLRFTTICSDSLLGRKVISLQIPVVGCSLCSPKGTSCDNENVTLASVRSHGIESAAKSSGTLLHSMENIYQKQLLIQVVLSKTLTARCPTTLSFIRTWRSPIRTKSDNMPLRLIASFATLHI